MFKNLFNCYLLCVINLIDVIYCYLYLKYRAYYNYNIVFLLLLQKFLILLKFLTKSV